MLIFCPQGGVTSRHIIIKDYNISVSEKISAFRAGSTGNDCALCFGCREIKARSALIFVNTVYRHVVLLLLQMLF